ncbi:hypothetical protein FQN54_001029 [Arachnomyces sp. PD_36]|nr:hypothetical protein FQN54_001029 [Arachnomyces sp. PD_36]
MTKKKPASGSAAWKALTPVSDRPNGLSSKRAGSWSECIGSVLGEVPTSVADGLNNDRSLLHTKKPHKEGRDASPGDPDATDTEESDLHGFSEKHDLSIEPEILRVLYQRYADSLKSRPGIDLDLPPLYGIHDIFDDISKKAEELGFKDVLAHLGTRKLRVVTVCSGTESPLLALKMVADGFKGLFGEAFDIEHLFSAEIVPFKQAYIERNFHPPIIFRDVKELTQPKATTAYGALRGVPVGADIMIAGFSCVDYSNLNKKRKKAGEIGESRDTFYATLNYAKKCRPPLIVLENVSGAPWPEITKDWEGIGYCATHVKVDTKNYYLPQTRERGYMFCVDTNLVNIMNPENDLGTTWKTLMGQFKRPASSPVDRFLLEEDDPRVQQIRREMASRNPRDGQTHDWSAYKTRHQIYRFEEQLGDKRPLTRWQDNGSCKMPDFAWNDWSKSQPERVWDTLDMNFLRSIYRGYDLNYKLRVLELSQGIDRETDRRAFGVVGCITPTGIPYITTRGGPLLGIEALAVQGIPIDDLLLTCETQRELQDLAGNAMSTTAVGVATLSALLAGFKILPSGPPNCAEPPPDPVASRTMSLNDNHMIKHVLDLSSFGQKPVNEILAMASKGSRLCLCEGRTSIAKGCIRICTMCTHTACFDCAGNPSHEYTNIPTHELSARRSPAEIAYQLKECLPMRFTLQGITVNAFDVFTRRDDHYHRSIWNNFLEVVQPALGEVLNFKDIIRGKTWIVRYEGAHSSARLMLSAHRAMWFLYVKAPRAEPSNSILRQILSQPIARMSPIPESLFVGEWKISSPLSSSFSLTVAGEGSTFEAWGTRVGLQSEDYLDSTVWTRLRVSASGDGIEDFGHNISGVYELLPDCGSASNSLHRKSANGSSPPVYLFLDPTKLGQPELDSFVFSWEHDRLDHDHPRVTIAEMTPLWQPSLVRNEPRTIQGFYRKQAICAGASIQNINLDTAAHCWTPTLDFVLDLGAKVCHEARLTLLQCSVPAANSGLPWAKGNWSMINLMDSPSVLKDFAWLIQKAPLVTTFADWREPRLDPSSSGNCNTCSPLRPKISWSRDIKGRIKPYEDPIEAGTFERQLKARPPPFVAFTRIDEHGIGHLQICVNMTTLIHQASSKLDMGNRTSLYWRLSIEDTAPQDTALPPFRVRGNRTSPEYAQPLGFKDHKLRFDQLRSLNWMIDQEKVGVSPFLEEEVEEAVLAPLNWRAEGRATASKTIRGGILADEVGYGKTATVLGLIDSQFSRGEQQVSESVHGLIPAKATLVVVPDVLTQQWNTEIVKFLGRKYKVLILSRYQSLGSATISDIQNADIILATWAILHGDAYYERMEQFAVTPKPPSGKGVGNGRVFTNWFRDALLRLADHVDILKGEGPKGLLGSIRRKRQEMETDAAYSMYTPSKRLRGRAYVEAQERKGSGGNNGVGQMESHKRKREDDVDEGDDTVESNKPPPFNTSVFGLSELPHLQDWTKTKCPLLHMFEFNRVVVDEFTYVDEKGFVTLAALRSRSKWILSGTPPLNNFADVKTISPFLGINLGIDDYGSGKHENTRLKEIQQSRSDAEHFHSFKAPHSAAWHRRRHGIAQRFLDQFMRQNSAEIDEIPMTEHFCPVILSSAERAIYIELYIQLMSQKLNPRNSIRSGLDNDQARRLHDLLKFRQTPREALQMRCSMFDPANPSSDGNHAGVSCSAIIGTREKQIEELGIEIGKKFKLALWLESNHDGPCRQFTNLKSTISNHSLGDEAVAAALKGYLSKAIEKGTPNDGNEFYRSRDAAGLTTMTEHSSNQGKAVKKAKNNVKERRTAGVQAEDDRPIFPTTQDEIQRELREVSSTLRKLFDEAISRQRAIRLLKAIRSFQEADPSDPSLRNCSKCGYQPPAGRNMFILGQCGHVGCEDCIEGLENNECMVKFCRGSALRYHLLKSEDLGRDEEHSKGTPYGGKKFEEVVKLLKDTTRIAEEDQVVLFVQFDQLMEAAKVALKANHITYSAIGANGSGAGKIVDEFKKGIKGGKSQGPKVLILNLSGETAAGLNLQNANHVIFLSPALTKTQYDYDSTMTQTVGRCRRFGQQKRVHVYHFIALETIDVNVLQHRRQQILVERKGEFLLVPEDQVLDTDKANWRGSSLDGDDARGAFDE